jgi:MoxR-like ATPase
MVADSGAQLHPSASPEIDEDVARAETLREAFLRIREEIAKVIVGQDGVVEDLLIAIFSRGHCLLVGVPGLAKTLLVRTVAQVLSLSFRRIQFTPDLMPSDITGTDILQEDPETGQRRLVFHKGPIFANIILADEINRTPPKTQAALLEAMQEYQVTAAGRDYHLEQPFFVLATQNPIEQEGTYPLPEAQLDRFMFNVKVDYPSEEDELRIMKQTTTSFEAELEKVLGRAELLKLQETVRRTPVAEHVYRYALALARSTRPNDARAPDFIKEWVSWGAGPRASQYLLLGAKARAILNGRYAARVEDVQRVAPIVLRHRIVTNYTAEAEGIDPDRIVERLLAVVKFQIPKSDSTL